VITLRLLIAGSALALGAATPLAAQRAQPGSDTSSAALQARVRQRLATVVKQRLGLTDEQVRQLAAVNSSYEGRRRDLVVRERDARVVIRREVKRGQSADQKAVDAALSDLFRIQRTRIDLAEQEQRDLAKFMQPSQRAGYLALQEQLRRRVDQMRKRRG
jgi:hypothetical protein